jgi:hypothetical protein
MVMNLHTEQGQKKYRQKLIGDGKKIAEFNRCSIFKPRLLNLTASFRQSLFCRWG